MRTLIHAALAAALATGSVTALAQSKFYFGGGAGLAEVELDCAGTLSCDKRDTAYKGFAGYMFTPNFGVEGSYTDLGRARAGVNFGSTVVEVGLQPRAYALFGVASLPVAERFALFAKAGAAYVDSKATVALGSLTAGDNDRAVTPAFGIGGSFRVMDGLAVRLEWERFRAEFAGEKGDVDFASLSVRFSLPQ
ncbi:MAG: outer membrane beta-barrel protein [Burkholderiaceae bacterium]|nr:outer membrane beta-barrel protein [Burkholderiaceae bacterium]